MKQIRLFEIVSQFFPIGIDDQVDKRFEEFTGTKQRYAMIDSKFNEEGSYKIWRSLLLHLKEVVGIPIGDNTMHGTPCYSAKLKIIHEKGYGVEFRQDLFLDITLLGPFFTMYGLDSIIYSREAKEDNYIFDPIACVSPEGVYSDSFSIIRSTVLDFFEGYTFASLLELSPRINGLHLSDVETTTGAFPSLYQALFLPHNTTNLKKRGDFSYC
ncbi:MAG: hypothetical protein R2828_10165 [Saprospiraceae bacterium]